MLIVHCSFIRVAAWLAAFWMLCASPLAAQNELAGEPPRVVAVRVVSESGAVLEENPFKLKIQPGQTYSTESESASLRELFRSGKYADLRAELADVPGGVRLDFVVRQNLFISRVQIDGLHEPPGEALALSALRLNVGEPFRINDMKDALDRLRQTLEDDGEYQAKLTYTTTPHPQTQQIDIVVHVMEGPRARVGAITIQNQTEFPDQDLRNHLKISEGGQITVERLNRVSDRARKWLTQNNFLGARVTIHRGTYDPKTNRVPLNFAMYAGLEVRVAVEGARISTGNLRKLIPIYQEGAVDQDLLQEGRRSLRDWFERAGYFDTQVSYTVAEAPAGKTGNTNHRAASVVTYQVNRGDHHRLVKVEFNGNKYFSSDLLRGRLKIQPAAYASPGHYSTELLQDDVASIRTLYEANGFEQCQVQSDLVDNYGGHNGDLSVTFEVKEGLQTRVASLTIDGNSQLSKDELLGVVGSSKGQPYSEFNVSSDRDNILATYYDQGFSEAQFTANVEKIPPATPNVGPTVRLSYHITEGLQVLVARVLLGGYEHTRPGVISREVGIKAGEPLSEGAVVETQRKLYNLGIFSRVSIAPQNPEGLDENKTIVVMVDEAKRYTIAYGLGFEAQRLGSSTNAAVVSLNFAPRGTLELTKANLTGRADSLSFKARASTIQGRALLTYIAPNYFASPNFSLQLSTFYETSRDVQTFDSRRAEASAGLAEKLSPTSKILYRYVYRHVVASNLKIAVEEIPLFSQSTEVSEFDVDWLRDRRNSPSDPTRGDFENIDVSLAARAIGSSANFIRVYLQNSTYHPIGRRLVFARSTRFGIQTVYGKSLSTDIPLPERFFAGGGTTIRGFALNQAGPRDPFTGFPIGGQSEIIFNQDLRFPMHLPLIGDRLGGAVFYDAGNVFPSIRRMSFRTAPPAPTFDPANPSVCLTNCTNDMNYFSHTVGFEFRYGTPIGPVALDLGYQLDPAKYLIQSGGTCPGVPASACLTSTTRLPSFQFFVNLGTTF
ncbi:MAG TPA: POTRA domain-containing protein [Candidatus Acidoferrales bacterium]|jgi:outer membrane protein assembly complex protein YaeT|nr:POTRA domain-containing protein [Candidatus Acidoferrales bacterium]